MLPWPGATEGSRAGALAEAARKKPVAGHVGRIFLSYYIMRLSLGITCKNISFDMLKKCDTNIVHFCVKA